MKTASPASTILVLVYSVLNGRVESPARVDAAGQHDVGHQGAADDVEIPAQQVDAREGKILRPDHERHQKIAQHRRHDRDQEEEHHDHAVHGEHLVIGVGLHQVALRRQQLEPDEHGKEAAEKKERRHRDQVEDRDPLVVGGQQPGLEAVPVVEIVQLRSGRSLIRRNCCTRHDYCTCIFCCVCAGEVAGWFCSPAVPGGGWANDLT